MIEKPKKERKFLKILGKVGEILLQELLLKVGRSLVQKIGGKKHLPSIIFLSLFYNIAFASIDSIPYPITGNKQRLGWQTTGNGLVYRGSASDTITKPSNYANKDIKAYFLLDTVNNVLYNYIASKGGWQFSNTDSIIINNNFMQPVDSLFFNTSVPPNNIDTAKMRWDYERGTVVLGMYDKVTNELGFKNFWAVKNQTGTTITKGSIVYANGTVGASGRITVAKFIANGSIDAKYLLGITAHDLSDGEDGYVISFGKIRQVNTDTFAAGAILYPSPTIAGVWTDVEPVAPNIDMPIGFCINSSSNNGTIAIRVNSGAKVHELQDVDTTGLNNGEGLVYNGSYFVASTGKLLTPSDTTSLSNRINAKVNTSDTASMLTNYLRTGTAASTYLPLTGGTLSGSSSSNNYTDTLLNVNYQYTGLPANQNVSGVIVNVNTNGENAYGILSETSTIYKTAIGVKGKANLLATGSNGIAYGVIGEISATSGGGSASNSYAGYFNNTSAVSDGNHYGLYVNTASGGDYGIYQTGTGTNYFSSNTSIGGTLGVTGNITGNSFIKSGGTSSQFLKADGSTDSNTYLTTSSAASTYLPLTGGTLSGNLNLSSGILNTWTSVYSSAPRNDGAISRGYFYNLRNSSGNYGNVTRVIHNYMFSQDENTAAPQTFYYGRLNGFYAQDYNAASASIIYDASIYYHNTNQFYYRAYSEPEDKITWSIKPATTVNTISGTRANMYLSGSETIDGSSTIGSTLGVTGFSTFSTGAVINENSNDSDTRIESDGNANMVFVDASTDRVGIGTSSPSKTLDVNGELKIATTTATPTSLLGKDGSNVVGNVRVISPLSIAGDSINLNTVPISKGGTGSTTESGARSNLGVGYVFYASSAGDAVSLSSNKVFIVNSGGASTTTLTLGTATAGRMYIIKNLATGTVISANSNVIPLNGGSAGTAILSAGNTTPQWCTLVCDGTNWVIMQSN